MGEDKKVDKIKDMRNSEDEYLNGYEHKYIIYLDDDNSVKKKVAWIKFENNGYWIKIIPASAPFWINTNRILKIKELKYPELKNSELGDKEVKDGR